MTDSIKLRHFPEKDPASTTSKDALRAEIEKQTKDFLSKGGKPTQCKDNESAAQHYPVRRTRKAQINFLRKRDFKRRKSSSDTP